MVTRLPWASATSGLAFLAACTAEPFVQRGAHDGDPRAACDVPAVGLRVEPPDSEAIVGERAGAAVSFRGLALLPDGSAAPIGGEWSIRPPEIGTIDERGRFDASGRSGGTATIRLSTLGRQAVARLEVVLVERIREAGIDETVAERFEADASRAEDPALVLVEPSDGATLPADPAAFAFRWQGHGHAAFRLRLESASFEYSVTTSVERHALAPAAWRRLADSSRGLPVDVRLEALGEGGALVRAPDVVRVVLCHFDERCNARDDDCDGALDESCSDPDQRAGAPERCP